MKSNNTSQATQSTFDDGRPAETEICIVGANKFNNEILSGYLESQTGLKCHCIQNNDLPTLDHQFPDKPVLLIQDCNAMGKPKMCETSSITNCLQNTHNVGVCINVDPSENLEHKALDKGIHGVIYSHWPIDLYPRACRAVLTGELWYPRKILNERFLATGKPVLVPESEDTPLTQREREIIKLLASGLRNHDIAKALCISPHTVKTHAYNLYKKINVSNRFQASQWISQRKSSAGM